MVQNKYPNDSRQLTAKVVKLSQSRISATGSKDEKSQALELQVNIEGQDHDILLPLDALNDYGLLGPAAVAELRGIREALGDLVRAVTRDQGKESRPQEDQG